ncbi:MAG: hypothetical protein EBT07_12470 [Actinobacteria bacterium]|nr:hypothetical protein [Actinomycetota bacterium]
MTPYFGPECGPLFSLQLVGLRAGALKKLKCFLSIKVWYAHTETTTKQRQSDPMAATITLDTSRIVTLLAAQYDFDPREGADFLITASQSARAPKRDFLEELAAAESKDEAKAKAKTKAKRAPSGWLLFCAEMRAVTAYSSPRAGKKLCERWREMDSAQRAVWNDKAALIKDAMKRGEPIPPFAQKWRRPLPCVSEADIVAREGEVWRKMVFWQAKATKE